MLAPRADARRDFELSLQALTIIDERSDRDLVNCALGGEGGCGTTTLKKAAEAKAQASSDDEEDRGFEVHAAEWAAALATVMCGPVRSRSTRTRILLTCA